MNDHDFETTKNRIIAAVRDWMSMLGLGWWNVIMDYDRRGLSTATVDVDARATDAEMRLVWNAPAIFDLTDAELGLLVLRTFLRAAYLDDVAADPSAAPRVAHLLAKTIQGVRMQKRGGNAQGIRDVVGRATRHIGVIEDPSVRAAPD